MTIELKTYSNASNARRAAKAAGLSEFDVYKTADGWYKIRAAAIKAAKAAKPARATAPEAAKAPKASKEPKQPKGNILIELVTEGATITKLTRVLGWQRHTVRAAICRLSKAGYIVQRTKVGTESHYKIAA